MEHSSAVLVFVASVLILGVGAQWLSWRLRFPSILLLLFAGFLAGYLGWIEPKTMLGERLLFPLVSLAVAVILFEGGLTLRLRELEIIGVALRNLLTFGAVLTWVLISLAAVWLLDLPAGTAWLLGAILTVTGPTVITPLLKHVRPRGRVGNIARWEGIIIDPIGATLAVLVFEVSSRVHAPTLASAIGDATLIISTTLLVGGALGLFGAALLVVLLYRYWIPDTLHNPVVLMVLTAVFTLANTIQQESGLLAVTVMGIALANQSFVPIRHILAFKEGISVILIGSLFILLAANIHYEQMLAVLNVQSLLFVAALMLVVRPLAVFAATLGSNLSNGERLFLAWLAPRGIVAASVSSVFALRLGHAGEQLAPLVFLVIVATVLIYGLTALPLARWLHLAVADPQGVLIASAHPGARAIAHALHSLQVPVRLVDTNLENVIAAKLEGLPCQYGSILSTNLLDKMDMSEIGRFLALTANDEVNSLACLHLGELFGRKEVYQLATTPKGNGTSATQITRDVVHGRLLFAADATFEQLDRRFEAGETVNKTPLTKEFDFEKFRALYGSEALPLFLVGPTGKLTVLTADTRIKPQPEQILLSLARNLHPKVKAAQVSDEDTVGSAS